MSYGTIDFDKPVGLVQQNPTVPVKVKDEKGNALSAAIVETDKIKQAETMLTGWRDSIANCWEKLVENVVEKGMWLEQAHKEFDARGKSTTDTYAAFLGRVKMDDATALNFRNTFIAHEKHKAELLAKPETGELTLSLVYKRAAEFKRKDKGKSKGNQGKGKSGKAPKVESRKTKNGSWVIHVPLVSGLQKTFQDAVNKFVEQLNKEIAGLKK